MDEVMRYALRHDPSLAGIGIGTIAAAGLA
jgi:hypothetical protein